MTTITEERSFYYDRYFDRNALKIQPGEFAATEKDVILVTVLGSCVSVCLRDPVTKVIGMNHFLLPTDISGNREKTKAASYGVHAMELLINDMIKLGAVRSRLQAKVFGGANVLTSLSIPNIGLQNSEFIRDYLARENINLLAEDLEGVHPRKIYFFPESGEVKMKKIRQLNNMTIIEREEQYCETLKQLPKGGDITFFD